MWVTFGIAFFVAAAFAGLESGSRRRPMPVYSDAVSFALWLLGLGLEGAAGCLAAFAVDEATTGLSRELVGVAGGLGAPALLRLRFAHVGATPLGVAYLYERAREPIDRRLDRRASLGYARWRRRVSEELLKRDQLTTLGDRLMAYVSAVKRLGADDAGRLAAAATIQRVLADPADAEKKMDLLLDLAHKYDADRMVREVYRDATGVSLRGLAWTQEGLVGFVLAVFGLAVADWRLALAALAAVALVLALLRVRALRAASPGAGPGIDRRVVLLTVAAMALGTGATLAWVLGGDDGQDQASEQELRAAARQVYRELEDAESALTQAARSRSWARALPIPTSQWTSYDDFLAAELDLEQWKRVSYFFRLADVANDNPQSFAGNAGQANVQNLRKQLIAARAALARYIR